MDTRRGFLGTMVTAPAAAALAGTAAATARGWAAPMLAPSSGLVAEIAATKIDTSDPSALDAAARDEDFWMTVQQAFTVDRSVINFNNGGVSPTPRVAQEAVKRHLDFSNNATAYSMWRVLEPQKETVRRMLGRTWGVDPEEVAITRNSSESLQTCQMGMDLKAGDEVVTTTQDYPRMLTTFKQRERREGIKLVQIKIPIPCEDNAAIVRAFEEAITPRTRMILASHVINITGQILPIRELVAMARTKNGGIPVVVDGAHALAQFDFKISDLDCDYYGVSLHKWLAAPHGTGLLYVRRDRIRSLWPLMAADEKQDEDIRKFEEIGTHPAAMLLGIAESLTLHQAIGAKRKEARLRYLRDSWAKPLLAASDRVRLHTSLKPEFSCAIGNVQIEGLESEKIGGYLWEKHKILVTPIKHAEFEGIRVTPSVYSTMDEVDRFVRTMLDVIKNGLPSTT